MKAFMKKFAVISLVLMMVIVSMPTGSLVYAIEGSDQVTKVTIQNSNRTKSITIYYLDSNAPGGYVEETISHASPVPFLIPNESTVKITLEYKGTTPFPGAVDFRANKNNNPPAPVNFYNEFYFIAGDDFIMDYVNYGVINYVTSWKDPGAAYDILSVEMFPDKYVEYGTTKGELGLKSEAYVTLDDEIPYGPGPTVVKLPITWDDGTPSYQGSENALFSATIDGDVDHSTYTIDLMVYVLFYDLVEIKKFADIEQPYSTVFTLPQEADVILDQWYLDDGSKVFTGISKNDTFEIDFYDAPGPNTNYELRNEEIYHASPTLPVNVFNPDEIEAIQKVLPLYLEIDDDLYLSTQTYLPVESEPTPPNVADAPLDNNSTYPLSIDWDMENPQLSDPEFGPREKVYTGKWILNEGIANTEGYEVFFKTSMNYWMIEDDVTLSYDDLLVGDPVPVLPNYVETPIKDNGLQMVEVEWGQPSIQETSDFRIYTYTGEFILYDGLLNPESYQVFAEIRFAYNEIESNVDLGVQQYAFGDPEPNRPNPVLTPMTIGEDKYFLVEWTLASSEMIDDMMIKSYVGNYNNLPEGVKNTNAYQAFFESHEKYLVIVDVMNPLVLDIPQGTPYGDLELPDTVQVEYDDGNFASLPVSWLQGSYDGINDLALIGNLTLPEGVLNPDELYPLQEINIFTEKIIDADDPEPVVVVPGTLLSDIIPQVAMAYFTDETLDGNWSVNFGSDFAITSDAVVRGNFDSLPSHVGNPDGIHVNQEITVQKVIITDDEDGEVESSGLTLRIGYNRSVAEGQAQLYYQLLPYFELDQDDQVVWSIVEGSSYIDLSDEGFVQGLDQGQATVKISVNYGQENENTLEDIITINVIEYATPSTPPTPPPTPETADPFITLDRNYVELEYGTDALEAFFSYDFTETIFNSNDSRVEWLIEDEEIASVDENGLVEAVSAGETRVTVRHTSSGATASATIVVFLVGEEENPLGAVQFFDPYIIGYPDQTFGPQRSVTRAEVATMFARILGLNLDFPGSPKYKDVSESAWYYKYIQASTRAGLFSGYADGVFKPDAPITRGEMATVFSKYWDFLDIEVNALPTNALADVDGSHWASVDIYKIYNAGIVKGFEDGSYRPNSYTLREQVVGMINTLIARPEFFPEATKYVDITKDHWAFGNIEAATTPYSAQGNLQFMNEEN